MIAEESFDVGPLASVPASVVAKDETGGNPGGAPLRVLASGISKRLSFLNISNRHFQQSFRKHPNRTFLEATADSLVDRIFCSLSRDEHHTAAKAHSYKYSLEPVEIDCVSNAKAMIASYVSAEQKIRKDKEINELEGSVLKKLRSTLKFREQYDVDSIRLSFGNEESNIHTPTSTSSIRERIVERFSNKAMFVCGYSKDNIAIVQVFPGVDTSWDEDLFIKGTIYMVERALACTERRTGGAKVKFMMCWNYNGYQMKNTPPISLVKRMFDILGDHYPGKCENVFLVDPPFIFKAFWKVVKHFVDPITSECTHLLKGESSKRRVLSEVVDDNQASVWMFKQGGNNKEIDMNSFFYDIPFEYAYGE